MLNTTTILTAAAAAPVAGHVTLFPFAVWWVPTRRLFLIIGTAFHLATAIFMGIPQMGLAFIACYAIWLDEATALRLTGWPERLWRGRKPVIT